MPRPKLKPKKQVGKGFGMGQTTPPETIPPTTTPTAPPDTIGEADINKLLEQSKANLTEKPKRVRRTKAEIEAERTGKPLAAGSYPQNPQLNPQLIPRDRSPELASAFKLYSELLLAKPLECDDLKFSDEEASALGKATSDLMNAFPEYFNNSDPRVAAIGGAFFIIAPIGYSKYKVYQNHVAKKSGETKNV